MLLCLLLSLPQLLLDCQKLPDLLIDVLLRLATNVLEFRGKGRSKIKRSPGLP